MSPDFIAGKPPDSSSLNTDSLPNAFYSDANFPPAWPLSDPTGAPTFVDGTVSDAMGQNGSLHDAGWGLNDETELGALSSGLILPGCQADNTGSF